MSDEFYQLFTSRVGNATHKMSVPELSFKKFQGILPGQLLRYWREEGWCGYGNGLFWIVNPEDYRGLVEMWLASTPYEKIDDYHVVARTAFGKLYAWGARNNRSLVISCPLNALVAIDKELRTPEEDPNLAIQIFLSSKSKKGCDLSDADGKSLFEQALKKLGPLAPDEVYGFEPALVAGGVNRVEHLNKLNLFAHLTILRELAEPTIPFAGVDPGLS
jgi:hypothetical protein